jgi:hypothetical protein
MITCRKCNLCKTESKFPKRATGGYYYTCKECRKAYEKAWRTEKSKDFQWRLKRTEQNKKRYYENRIRNT